MRPLDGITVVTLEHAIAAPFCTRQTAPVARYKNCLRWDVSWCLPGSMAVGLMPGGRGVASRTMAIIVWANAAVLPRTAASGIVY